MNIARLNMSHGDHASHLQVIQVVQKLNERLNHPIALLLDLQGPAIRTGDRLGHLSLEVGQEFHVTVGPTENPEERTIHVDYQDMVHQLKVGDRITVDNGLINLEVLEVRERDLRCRVLDGGVLGSRKHINLPGVRINLPSISDQDVADIRFAAEHDIDFLAVSFVRCAEAVRDARRIIAEAGGHPMRIIAKIENQEGIDNLDEIIDAADGIMVARGDLGVEVEFEMLPVAQRDMVRRCAIAGRPVIVATHLLESMIDNPMPTRAEVTDVANAVYEQVDAVMLSGETATGKYPVRCVSVLDRIARRIEKERGLELHRDREPKTIRDQLARSACLLADSLGSRAIVVMTMRGVKGGTKLDQMAEENQTTWPLGRVSENGCAAGFRSVRARLRACPASAPARPHSQPRAKGGVRMVERQRRGGRACCVRDDSCRRSAPGCGRDESADRAARQSAVRSRRSRSIR